MNRLLGIAYAAILTTNSIVRAELSTLQIQQVVANGAALTVFVQQPQDTAKAKHQAVDSTSKKPTAKPAKKQSAKPEKKADDNPGLGEVGPRTPSTQPPRPKNPRDTTPPKPKSPKDTTPN